MKCEEREWQFPQTTTTNKRTNERTNLNILEVNGDKFVLVHNGHKVQRIFLLWDEILELKDLKAEGEFFDLGFPMINHK